MRAGVLAPPPLSLSPPTSTAPNSPECTRVPLRMGAHHEPCMVHVRLHAITPTPHPGDPQYPMPNELSLFHPLPPRRAVPSFQCHPRNRYANSATSYSASFTCTPDAMVTAQGSQMRRGGGSAPQTASPCPPPTWQPETPPSPFSAPGAATSRRRGVAHAAWIGL